MKFIATGAVLVMALVLTGCSITITATDPDGASANAETAAPLTEEEVVADTNTKIYDFCVLEAVGSLDLLSLMEDETAVAIADGIETSINNQEATAEEADLCTQAWVDTLAEAGLTYDPATGEVSGAITNIPEAGPADDLNLE
ncbi:MAG: hypothetical protein RJB01_815 [Actinomycetota bacterium]